MTGKKIAVIDDSKCLMAVWCKEQCVHGCKHDLIFRTNQRHQMSIIIKLCLGCGECVEACSVGAITLEDK